MILQESRDTEGNHDTIHHAATELNETRILESSMEKKMAPSTKAERSKLETIAQQSTKTVAEERRVDIKHCIFKRKSANSTISWWHDTRTVHERRRGGEVRRKWIRRRSSTRHCSCQMLLKWGVGEEENVGHRISFWSFTTSRLHSTSRLFCACAEVELPRLNRFV